MAIYYNRASHKNLIKHSHSR